MPLFAPVTQANGLLIFVPTQTKVYEHRLLDRQGNELTFFTATGSGDVSYLSQPEATIRGCEATYLRYHGLTPRSFDVNTTIGLSALMYVPVKSPSRPPVMALMHAKKSAFSG